MNELMVALIAGVIALFSTVVGSFAGGATSLIMFPLILMFAVGNYIDAFTANKIGTLFMTIAASQIHSKKRKVNVSLFVTLLVFGLMGTAIGTYLVQYQLNEELFKKILATCLIGIGLYLFFSKDKGVHTRTHRKIGFYVLFFAAIFSMLINILNGIFGGTGLFLTLFFVLFLKTTFIESMVYTMPVYAIINVFQTTYLAYTTNIISNHPLLAITMACCGLLGGMIGTNLQYLKGNVWVKRVAVLVMIAVGIKTFLG
jgi:uncharacterized membrane protein YfcA